MKRNPKTLIISLLSVSLLGGAALAGGCPGTTQQPAQITKYVTSEEAYALMQSNPDYVIIDTRNPDAFANEHIEGAINIDYLSENFYDELNQLDKSDATFAYYKYYKSYGHTINCSKCDESSDTLKAVLDIFETFKELEFKEAYFIDGGILTWKAKGFPTTK